MHLRLGRKIYQFIGIGQWFESKTFEYLVIAKEGAEYSLKLVRALDYMYPLSPVVDEFETVESLENESVAKIADSLERCLGWAFEEYECSADEWSLDITEVYLGYVESGDLGQRGRMR